MTGKNDLTRLSNEITYHRYMLSHKKAESLYTDITMSEYIALKHISEHEGERVYLKEIADGMDITVQKASKGVRRLRDRGLVTWEHDGNGSDGTYVTITETGEKLLREQETVLKDYYGRVIEIFGEDRLEELLELLRELEDAMDGALDGKEA